jgi:sulfur carrier protein
MSGPKPPPGTHLGRVRLLRSVPTLSPNHRRTILTGMTSSITLTLNGEVRIFEGADAAPFSVAALLVEIGLDTKKVAVERNEEIVPRSRYAETWLASGDTLEIVHFIGGG